MVSVFIVWKQISEILKPVGFNFFVKHVINNLVDVIKHHHILFFSILIFALFVMYPLSCLIFYFDLMKRSRVIGNGHIDDLWEGSIHQIQTCNIGGICLLFKLYIIVVGIQIPAIISLWCFNRAFALFDCHPWFLICIFILAKQNQTINTL